MKTLPLEPVTVSNPTEQEARILHHVESSRVAAKAGIDNQRHAEAVSAALLKLDLVLAEHGYSEIVGLSTADGSKHLFGRERLEVKRSRLGRSISLDTIPVDSFSQEQLPEQVLAKVRELGALKLFNELRVGAYYPGFFKAPHEKHLIGCATTDRFLIGVIGEIERDNSLISEIFRDEEGNPAPYYGWGLHSDSFYMEEPRFFLITQWQVSPH